MLKNYREFSRSQIGDLSLGFIVSFIVALLSIKFFLSYIKKHDFKAFGIYRILVSLLFIFAVKE
jgi:undecaprenyl-diphosphatase